jgi:hypothetical protein
VLSNGEFKKFSVPKISNAVLNTDHHEMLWAFVENTAPP